MNNTASVSTYHRLARVLHASRAIGSATAMVLLAAASLLWDWPPGLVAAAAVTPLLIDSMVRVRHPGASAAPSLMLDATVVSLAIALTRPPFAALLAPLAVSAALAPLVMSGIRAALVAGYAMLAVGGTTVLVDRVLEPATWSAGEAALLTIISFVVFVPYLGRVALEATRDEARRARHRSDLEAREERLRTLFEGLPVGAYRTALDGTILEANPALVSLLGYPDRESLVGQSALVTYASPADRAAWAASTDETGSLPAVLHRMRRRDGTQMWVRDSARAVTDAQGSVLYFEGTLEDVTEEGRRQAYERAIFALSRGLLTERTQEAIRAGLDELLLAAEVTSVFVERNSEHPVLGPCSSLVYEADAEDLVVDYDRWTMTPWADMPQAFAHLSQGLPFSFDVTQLDGPERALYAGVATKRELDVPIFIGERWVGLVGLTDSTGSREWDERDVRLLQTVAEMIGASWERDAQQERLEQLVRAKDEFVASVSHELRTPLTAVVGAASLLHSETDLADSDREELTALLAAQSTEVAHIVEDLLVAARADIGRVAVAARQFDLPVLVGAVVGALPGPDRDAVTLDIQALEAWGDPTRVRQVLRNLLTNAFRYGGGKVAVRASVVSGEVRVDVCDDGPGIPEHLREKVFEPYERAHDIATQPASVGLGLTISRQLARLMGGDIVYSYEGGVSTFTFTLPAKAPADTPADG